MEMSYILVACCRHAGMQNNHNISIVRLKGGLCSKGDTNLSDALSTRVFIRGGGAKEDINYQLIQL